MGTIDVPIFYGEGDDPMEWMSWINDFCSNQGFSDCETQRFAYGFIEGEALRWYHEENSRSVFKSWANLKLRLLMRFSKRKTQPVTTSRKDLLNQLSRLLDRWDEEDEAKKQQGEEMMAAGDSNQILSSVEGFVKSFSAPPVTVSEEKDDLLTWIETPPVLLETMDDAVICVKAREEEDQLASMESVFQKTHSYELRGNTRKKKKRWKASLEIQKSFENELGFERKEHLDCGRELPEFLELKGRVEKRKGAKESGSEIYAYQLLDQLHPRRKKVKKKRCKETVRSTVRNVARGRYYHGKEDTTERVNMDKRVKIKMQKDQGFGRTMLLWNGKKENYKPCGLSQRCRKKERARLRTMVQRMNNQRLETEADRMRISPKLVLSKLLSDHITAKKKIVKCQKTKFKQKLYRTMKSINEKFSGKQIVVLWNAKIVSELVRGNFRGKWKSKYNHKMACLSGEELLQLKDVLRQQCKWLAAKIMNRVKMKYQYGVWENLVWLVTSVWTEPRIKVKKHKVQHKTEIRWMTTNKLKLFSSHYSFKLKCLRNVLKEEIEVCGKLISLVTIGMRILMEGKQHKIRYKYKDKHKVKYKRRSYWGKCVFQVKLLLVLMGIEQHINERCKVKQQTFGNAHQMFGVCSINVSPQVLESTCIGLKLQWREISKNLEVGWNELMEVVRKQTPPLVTVQVKLLDKRDFTRQNMRRMKKGKRVVKKQVKSRTHKFKQKRQKEWVKFDGVVIKSMKLLSAERRKKATSRLLCVVDEKLSSLVTIGWMKVMLEWRKRKKKQPAYQRSCFTNALIWGRKLFGFVKLVVKQFVISEKRAKIVKTVKIVKQQEVYKYTSVPSNYNHGMFQSPRPPEQSTESWNAGQWSGVGSNFDRKWVSLKKGLKTAGTVNLDLTDKRDRVLKTESYDHMSLKLRQLSELQLTNMVYEKEHNYGTSKEEWLKEPAAYQLVTEGTYEILYTTRDMFHFLRPPELYQEKNHCCGGCQPVKVQVKVGCCFFNLEDKVDLKGRSNDTMGYLQIQEVQEEGPERVKAQVWPKNVGVLFYVSRRIMTWIGGSRGTWSVGDSEKV